jgi:hypothetical protein
MFKPATLRMSQPIQNGAGGINPDNQGRYHGPAAAPIIAAIDYAAKNR